MPEIENDAARSGTFLRSRAGRPTGVIPRNAQAMMIVGISAVMVAAIAFSGPSSKTAAKPAPLPNPGVTDPNQARIAEYRSRLDEEARKLAAEQAQVVEARRQFANATAARSQKTESVPAPGTESSAPAEDNGIENDRRRRAYLSLFASNIALSYRKNNLRQTSEMPEPRDDPGYTHSGPAFSVPVSSQVAHRSDNDPSTVADLASRPDDEPDAHSDRAAPNPSVQSSRQDQGADPGALQDKKYRLFEGTVLEAVLTNRLNGSYSGPVNCMLTTNVYSHDGQRLLIPQGSRVLGEVRRVNMLGQERLAVFFHRLVMPDGYSLSLDKFAGLNQIGETGLQDQVNHHYAEVFGASLAIGAIAGLAQANTNGGLVQSSGDAYRQGLASNLSQSSLHVLDRYLNILPTITIREGHRIKIYLAGDLLVPAFDHHRMQEDL